MVMEFDRQGGAFTAASSRGKQLVACPAILREDYLKMNLSTRAPWLFHAIRRMKEERNDGFLQLAQLFRRFMQ